MAHRVSVQVCTLNEQENIGTCLDLIAANEPEDILVIDGGSSDMTIQIARKRGVRVIQVGPVGLAAQRRAGIVESRSPYTAFVDADDRLEPTWLDTMVHELKEGDYAALQSLVRVPVSGSWWSSAWNRYFTSAIVQTPDVIMVGRPALFETSALTALPEPAGMVVEDTEMSQQLLLMGHRMGIGSAVSWRLCPITLRENFMKWQGYGQGYRQFVRRFPGRKGAIAKHMLLTVPVGRTLPSVLRGHPTQILFGTLMSVSMSIGWCRESLRPS